MEDRITVAQTLELGVAVTWQQAVAITLEAWHVADLAHVRGRPVHLAAESCVLTVTGDVVLPIAAAAHNPDGALQLLRAMLDGVDAPPELVDIAFGGRPASLSDDLAAFSRPHRRVEIVDVASRAVTALAALGLTARSAGSLGQAATTAAAPPPVTEPTARGTAPRDAFEVLRDEAASRPPAAAPRPLPRPAPSRRRWVPVLASAVATLAAVITWRAWPDAASSAAPASAPTPAVVAATLLEASTPDPAWFAAGRRETDIPLPRRPVRQAAADRLGADTSGTAGPVVEPAGPPGATAPTAAFVDPIASGANNGVARVDDAAGATGAADEGVYSWQSVGVTPPAMIFPRMPRTAFPEPGALLEDRPYLEVLVNERGDVDEVRLRGNLTTTELVRHGMMLAPAKAWHFTPATRDGHPVRYVVRVLVGQ